VGYPFIDREKLQMADFDEIIVTSSKYYNEISEELQNSFCIPVNKIILMDDLIEEVYKRYFQLIRTELKLADHPEYLKRISIQHVQAAMG
jgi:hypothetical protein